MGRGFTPDEEKAGAAPVVLLSYALWQSRFGADRRAIGQMIRLDSQTVTIVGVLPQDFPLGAGASLGREMRCDGADGHVGYAQRQRHRQGRPRRPARPQAGHVGFFWDGLHDSDTPKGRSR
jgi:hypothetical protein